MGPCLKLSSSARPESARRVSPERLDELPPNDPAAQQSRQDLQRIHVLMRSVSILKGGIDKLALRSPPRTILELGAGDGSLMLRLARSIRPPWRDIEVTFLDRHEIVSPATRNGFEALSWSVKVIEVDALQWARSAAGASYDLCVATLFLHHFIESDLRPLLRAVAARSNGFLACEPRRGAAARLGSRLIGLVGVNHVTRDDAITSVAAGFAGAELSACWPRDSTHWWLAEYAAWPFTHCFLASRGERGLHEPA
jgi:hypothetical protein